MQLSSLIQEITPLYNSYKQNGKNISGTDALKIMWDIGDLLKQYIKNHNIAPHNLYREIYGKSEGSTNVTQKSYITREFQGRCYRIRNIFKDKQEIQKELPKLQSFTNFREAMPFFDNKKFKLQGEDKKKLLELLNGNLAPSLILDKIKKLQKEKIGIKNPRTQQLEQLTNEKNIFIDFYNYVYHLINQDQKQILRDLKEKKIDRSLILILAKNTNALSDDGIRSYEFEMDSKIQDPVWKKFGDTVNFFINQNTPKTIRRFRKIIPPVRIVKLADMLYSLSSKIT